MEERKLDARESMELISRMIQNTRNRLENHAGRPFLVWGYTTVGIALLNYWFNIAGCHPAWCFTWFLIPIIGCLLMRLFPDKKPTEPRTEIDRIVGKVWLVSSLSLIPIFLFSLFHGLSYRHSLFELITLVMATATATTGMIVRSKIYIVAGLTCMALSVLFPFCKNSNATIATTSPAELLRYFVSFVMPFLLFWFHNSMLLCPSPENALLPKAAPLSRLKVHSGSESYG